MLPSNLNNIRDKTTPIKMELEKVQDFPSPPPPPLSATSPVSPFVKIQIAALEYTGQPAPHHHHHPHQAVVQPLPQPAAANQKVQNNQRQLLYPEWLALIMGFSFAAIGSGLQCQDSSHPQQLFSLHASRLGLVFALAAFVVSKYTPPKFGAQAQVLEYVGVFCGVTAFFLAIMASFPLSLKLISWTIYVISLMAIIISRSLEFFQVGVQILPYVMRP